MTTGQPERRDRRAAFVVWIDPDPDDAGGERLRGTVEHVQSSYRIAFSGVSELTGFLLEHRSRAGEETQ